MIVFVGIACIFAGYIVLDKPSAWAWQNNFPMYQQLAFIGWSLTVIGWVLAIVGVFAL